jgi:hypothetical protein
MAMPTYHLSRVAKKAKVRRLGKRVLRLIGLLLVPWLQCCFEVNWPKPAGQPLAAIGKARRKPACLDRVLLQAGRSGHDQAATARWRWTIGLLPGLLPVRAGATLEYRMAVLAQGAA